MKRNKYGAKTVLDDGYRFDSQLEHKRYCELKLLLKAGEITELNIHPQYRCAVNGKKICTVILDFEYKDAVTGEMHYIDVKGYDTALSRLKRKLIEAVYGVTVEIIK